MKGKDCSNESKRTYHAIRNLERLDSVDNHGWSFEARRVTTELSIDQAPRAAFDSGSGTERCTAEAAPAESCNSKFSARSDVLFLAVSIHP